jgi:uncharacterized protein (TIGR02145 family)
MIMKQLLNTPSLVVRIILATIMLGANFSCTEKDIQPSDLLILTPGKGEIFYTGTNIRLTWSAPLAKHVSMELFQGSELICTIAKDVQNSSVIDWKIPADIPEGTGYSVRISNSEDKTRTVFSNNIEIRQPGERSSFTDDRDGQTYNTVKIGTQWWMAENYNLKSEESYCYKERESECEMYGRLYTIEAALENAPDGWHLPSDNEWKQLEEYLGVEPDEIDGFGARGRFSGNLLFVGGGTGFDAQLGGYQNNCVGNKFGHKVWESHIWSSDCNREGKQIVRVFVNLSGKISRVATLCHNASSVRYIKDARAD